MVLKYLSMVVYFYSGHLKFGELVREMTRVWPVSVFQFVAPGRCVMSNCPGYEHEPHSCNHDYDHSSWVSSDIVREVRRSQTWMYIHRADNTIQNNASSMESWVLTLEWVDRAEKLGAFTWTSVESIRFGTSLRSKVREFVNFLYIYIDICR